MYARFEAVLVPPTGCSVHYRPQTYCSHTPTRRSSEEIWQIHRVYTFLGVEFRRLNFQLNVRICRRTNDVLLVGIPSEQHTWRASLVHSIYFLQATGSRHVHAGDTTHADASTKWALTSQQAAGGVTSRSPEVYLSERRTRSHDGESAWILQMIDSWKGI